MKEEADAGKSLSVSAPQGPAQPSDAAFDPESRILGHAEAFFGLQHAARKHRSAAISGLPLSVSAAERALRLRKRDMKRISKRFCETSASSLHVYLPVRFEAL
jgi:hypothetical protein